jgi:hypothetical protein
VRDEKNLSKNLLELLVPEWTKDAACQVVVDKELFFPIRVAASRSLATSAPSVKSDLSASCTASTPIKCSESGVRLRTSNDASCDELDAITIRPLS